MEHAHASCQEGTSYPGNLQDGAYHGGATSPQLCASVHTLLRSILLSKENQPCLHVR